MRCLPPADCCLLGDAVLIVAAALAWHLTRRKAARISKELELASTSDNSPSDLSKFSDLERGVYIGVNSNGSGTGVIRCA